MSSSAEPQSKKVRLACRRCRLRRVKCDGSVPACGNCSRAGAPCVDVDGRNADHLIPRSFIASGPARIRWLEDVIRTHLPGFDLTQGPQVDAMPSEAPLGTADGTDEAPQATAAPASLPQSTPSPTTGPIDPSLQSQQAPFYPPRDTTYTQVPKRMSSHISADVELPLRDEARSVAVGLGMLSLNSDSRQKHYLGSSSGVLFTRVIGAESESDETSPGAMQQTDVELAAQQPNPRRLSRLGDRRTTAQHRLEQQNLQALYRRLQNDLPAREEAYGLVELYFREIHPDHAVLHAPSLLNAMKAIYDCVELGPHEGVARAGPNGWPESIAPFMYNGEFDLSAGDTVRLTPITMHTAAFHVFMVLHLAATVRTRGKDFDISPTRLYRAAMSYAAECFSVISLPSLQALLLLTVRALMIPAELNPWTLIHVCMAHCIDIGIHRETEGIGEVAANVRRFVFYTAYTLERSIATIQGRPLGVRDEAFDVNLPEPMASTHVEQDSAHDSTDTLRISEIAVHTTPYTVHTFKLHRIISDIKGMLYLLPPKVSDFPLWPKDPPKCQEDFRRALDDWLAQVPSVVASMDALSGAESDKFRLKLELRYHQGMVLLYQPSQAIRHPSSRALASCLTNSAKRIHGYDALYASDDLYLSWRTVQSIYASGTVMISCFWAADPATRASVLFAGLSKDLRTCSNLLSASGEWWPSIKRGKDGFERLVDLTLRNLGRTQFNGSGGGDAARAFKARRLTPTVTPESASLASVTTVGQDSVDLESIDHQQLGQHHHAGQKTPGLEGGVSPELAHGGSGGLAYDQSSLAMDNSDNFIIIPAEMESFVNPVQQTGDPGWDFFGTAAPHWFDLGMNQ